MGKCYSFRVRGDPAEPLVPLLNDPDRDVRLMCIWALGEMEEPSAVDHLRRCAEDKDEEISHRATEAIRWIEGTRGEALDDGGS